ncbi:MAG TPA: DUF4350 domain-containing protein [Ramlibacter sp.]|nr:DUF4350 domain-containing protein [Ramlibacter sp.]
MNTIVLRVVLVALLATAVGWLVTSTEWAEVETDKPATGEALTNPLFATGLLAARLGAQAERRENLDVLPPAGTVLLLESSHWDLFPGRPRHLHDWVAAGGHLVVPGHTADHEELAEWLPLRMEERPTPARPPGQRLPRTPSCRQLDEQPPATGADNEPYRVCVRPFWQAMQLDPGVQPLWSLTGTQGLEVVRLGVGRGTVTVFGPAALPRNNEVLRADADHAAIMARALQLQAGTRVWLVPEEARPPLLAWTWQHAWPAVLLALAAIAAWVWRSAVRFGPVAVPPAPQRRSMREQVTGTGAFLKRHGAAALHAAQVRALQDAARRRLPGYGRLQDVAAVEALAQASGLDAGELGRALRKPSPGAPHLAADLELLELARRRLVHPSSPTTAP